MAAMRLDLPTGTVTFLFTDVEGSTKLLHELGPVAVDRLLGQLGSGRPRLRRRHPPNVLGRALAGLTGKVGLAPLLGAGNRTSA